ncbi:MAG: hypothetical protein HY423_02330 [Candidatus Lambdaproteobacteria bacterium]|nr:hypothetical protein [Candidatus Lambdaproteobacteria bacterium]
MEKHLTALRNAGIIAKYIVNDKDKEPDFHVWRSADKPQIAIECKNVRDAEEGYWKGGKVIAYKVETQKTRTSNKDARSRFYDAGYFQILAVCLGKKTGKWDQFVYINERFLTRHSKYSNKLAVMHRVPLPTEPDVHPWRFSLDEVVSEF